MAVKTVSSGNNNNNSLCSVYSLFFSISLLCVISLIFFFLFNTTHPAPKSSLSSYSLHSQLPSDSINVYVSDLPRSLNYDILHKYWSLNDDSRLSSEVDNQIRSTQLWKPNNHEFPPYPESPLIKQYSAEYWIMGDLMTPEESRTVSFARRVFDVEVADVVFVPFFVTLSVELQLGVAKGVFRKKAAGRLLKLVRRSRTLFDSVWRYLYLGLGARLTD